MKSSIIIAAISLLRRMATAQFVAFVVASSATAAHASQLVLNATGGTMTLGTDFVLTGSSVATPAGTLSIDCPITSVGGGTTVIYTCTGGSFSFQSTDGTITVAASFGAAALDLSASGGGKGGNIKYYYNFNGSFKGTETVNGVSAAINGQTIAAIGPLRSQVGSGSATACCAAAGITWAYTPVYITDYSFSRLVRSDDLWGTNAQTFGSTGKGTNQFYGPHGLTVDPSGRIYVADTYNCRIVRIDNITGANWTTLGGSSCGSGVKQFSSGGLADVTLDSSGRIYVADPGNNRIVRSDDMSGTNWTTFTSSGANSLAGAQGIAVDSAGKIYIADSGTKRIVRMDDMTGTNFTTLTQSPVINGYIYLFGSPAHIALDPIGRIVVGDGSNVIRVDDMTGTNWAQISVGTTVEGLSVDASGTTFVAGTQSSGGAGLALFDDNTTGAGFTTSNFVSQTGGIFAVPVPMPVPAVTLAPLNLVFAQQNTGTASAPQNVTLTNFGGAPLTIGGIATTGDFSQNNTCGAILAGGSSCTISVAYTPQATGPETGSVIITDNAFLGSQTIALAGTGTAPEAGIYPTSITFQPQLLNTSSGSQFVFLSDTGTGALTFSGSGIATSGDFAQTNNCGTALSPATSCTVSVSFTPTVPGTRIGSLSITSNGVPLSVSLTGTGASVAPIITAAPESLVFSTELVKSKSPVQTVTLTNYGTAAVKVSSVTISGDFAKTGTCPASLAAGKSCKLNVTFTPTAAGIRSGLLTFTLSSGPVVVPLAGTGVFSATGRLTFSPPSLDFNGYVVGDNPDLQITVTNTNGVPDGIIKIAKSGSTTFTQTNNCGSILAAYATCVIDVTFIPTKVGTVTGTLTVTESGGTANKIPLSGTATTGN